LIISVKDVEDNFEKTLGKGIGKTILNKFVHGDIIDIVKYSNNPKANQNKLDQIKWVADGESYRIGYDILKITVEIAEILYLK